MRLNAFFPSLDIGTDPARIRDWAQAVDGLPALQISTVVPSREGACQTPSGTAPFAS